MQGRDSSIVRAPGIVQWLERRTHDRKVVDLSPGRSSRRIFFSRVNLLCWLLFWYPFHPHVTAVAHKKSWSFCQTCRWQVTAKQACALHNWLCMKWHMVHDCMVYTEWAEMAAVSRHQPCKNQTVLQLHHLGGYSKHAVKSYSHSFRVTWQEHSESAWERRIMLPKSS